MTLKDFVKETLRSMPKDTEVSLDLAVYPFDDGGGANIIISTNGESGLSRVKFTISNRKPIKLPISGLGRINGR